MPDQARAGSDLAERIGLPIRATHPDGFRSGTWGRVLGLVEANGRLCWQVGFEDEVCDLWVVDDVSDPYQFGVAATAESAPIGPESAP